MTLICVTKVIKKKLQCQAFEHGPREHVKAYLVMREFNFKDVVDMERDAMVVKVEAIKCANSIHLNENNQRTMGLVLFRCINFLRLFPSWLQARLNIYKSICENQVFIGSNFSLCAYFVTTLNKMLWE